VNRGGEKVSCAEVEGAVLEHPAVLEAAVFAVPDTRLGEEVREDGCPCGLVFD
jgi:long-chain acyl-CoA synthetase